LSTIQSSITYFKHFINTFENDKELDEFERFPTWKYIYKNSSINWEWLFQNISMLSVETSHTLNQLEEMEFYKFDKLIYFVDKYLERKNGDGNQQSEEFSNIQQSMKSFQNSIKPPKIKSPKI